MSFLLFLSAFLEYLLIVDGDKDDKKDGEDERGSNAPALTSVVRYRDRREKRRRTLETPTSANLDLADRIVGASVTSILHTAVHTVPLSIL